MPRLLLASLVVFLGALAGLLFSSCGSPCQDLGSRICGCQPPGGLQDACNTTVKNQISSGSQQPNSADQAHCQELLSTCVAPSDPLVPGRTIDFCYFLQSPQGKCACGLSPALADGGCLDSANLDGGTTDGGSDGGP
ncbi:MAG TPA: hypothetical protein VLV17_02490 [Anaeromyxobacteraceae bacterium]|nr:hypothetical protein [Anaeromyxobacteraceae bacterium]